MRCYTITEAPTASCGLRVQDARELGIDPECQEDLEFGVQMGSALLPVEKKICDHLSECQTALYKRISGDTTPDKLLGELRGKLIVTPDSAKDVAEEVIEGWYVDNLSVDPETLYLYHIPYDWRENRCLVLVAPVIDKGGSIAYLSNVYSEQLIGQRVKRSYEPVERAIGVEAVHWEEEDDNGWVLFRLNNGAGFRILRLNCSSGWRECAVHWNGRDLKQRVYYDRNQKKKAA